MKVRFTKYIEEQSFEDVVNTLYKDKDGMMWFRCEGGAVFLDEDSGTVYSEEEWQEAISTFGPFTVFNGSITLEND